MKKLAVTFVISTVAWYSFAGEWIKGDYVRPDSDDTAAPFQECRNDVLKRSFVAMESPVRRVTGASGWLDTPKGRLSVSGKLENGKMIVGKSIPSGVKVVE